MLRNYFIIALRKLLKHKTFSVINITGLALGLATGIFIMMFVLDELSFDRFHEKSDRIYRVVAASYNSKTDEPEGKMETNGWPIGALLVKQFPEVESMVYLRNASQLMVTQNEKHIQEKLLFAGKDFFHIFSFDLLKGNSKTALTLITVSFQTIGAAITNPVKSLRSE